MKSFSSNHNHNTSGHSLRKFRNMKYFQDQRGYETDYMKKKNDGQGNTSSNKKCMNKFDEQVNEYLRKAGSRCYGESMIADENKNLDYASEVESKIKSLETKHLASSSVFKQLSHCHSELMNLHNVQQTSMNQTELKITNKSLENSQRQISQRQFKSSSNLTITNTPYRSPSFQNKKSTKSMQIHLNPYGFNQSNIGDVQKILESSLDKLDEEDIAENMNVRQKILDSLNELNADEENFINLDGTDEQEDVYYINGKILQKEFNNKTNIANLNLSDSCDLFMQNIDESENDQTNQKIQQQSNIKQINHQNDNNNYYISQKLNKETTDKKRNQYESVNQFSLNQSLINNNMLNLTQLHNNASPINYNRFLSPDSTQKKPTIQTAQINFRRNSKDLLTQKNNKTQEQIQQFAQPNMKVKNFVQPQENKQKTLNQNQQNQQQRSKQIPSSARENNRKKSAQKQNRENTRQVSESKQNSENKRRSSIPISNNIQSPGSQLNKSPILSKTNAQKNQNQSNNIEKYYLQQVERQNDIVSQQQKQILQYQQQFQKQTLEFQLFMQEQQLLKQQQYFQQQQQIMQQQRLSANNNLFFQNPALTTSLTPNLNTNFQNHLLLQNQLPGSSQFIPSLLIQGQQQSPAGTAQFIPQSPPIIINNNIQKKDFEEANTSQNNQNTSKNSQQNSNAFVKINKNQSQNQSSTFNYGICDKNTDETLTLNATQQASGDLSQQTLFERQNEELFKHNNDSTSSKNNGNTLKRLSSQRRRWDIGQKTNPQSELSGDEGYLTSTKREVKQPKQFQLNPQLQVNVQLGQQAQSTKHILKKPVKFEIFWEKEEQDQENKENIQNNSNKCNNNDNKSESSIQKQYKNAVDQAENSSSALGQQKNLQDIFVSKKTDLQKRLDCEKSAQNHVIQNRNQSPEISKEDLIQIRKDLLKPKSQQVTQSINYDYRSNNNNKNNNTNNNHHLSSQNQTSIQDNLKPTSIQQENHKLNPIENQYNQTQIQPNSTLQLQQKLPYQQFQSSESNKNLLQNQYQEPQLQKQQQPQLYQSPSQQYLQSQQLSLTLQPSVPQPYQQTQQYIQSQQYTQSQQIDQQKQFSSPQLYPKIELQQKYEPVQQNPQYNQIQQYPSLPSQQQQPQKQLYELQDISKKLIDQTQNPQQQSQQQNSFAQTPTTSYQPYQIQQQSQIQDSYLNIPSQMNINDKFYKTLNLQTPTSTQQDKQIFSYLNDNSSTYQTVLGTNSNITPAGVSQTLFNQKFTNPAISGIGSIQFSDQNDSNFRLQKGFTSQVY